jgi:hypothetical protein
MLFSITSAVPPFIRLMWSLKSFQNSVVTHHLLSGVKEIQSSLQSLELKTNGINYMHSCSLTVFENRSQQFTLFFVLPSFSF